MTPVRAAAAKSTRSAAATNSPVRFTHGECRTLKYPIFRSVSPDRLRFSFSVWGRMEANDAIMGHPLCGKEKIMSIGPEGEQLRKAVKWVSDERTENPKIPLFSLIEKACLKFDLTPKDEEFLMRHFTEEGSAKQ